MADLGFLPVRAPAARHDPARRPADAVLGHPRRRRRRPRQALPDQPGHPQRRLGASRRSSTMTHHVLHVEARRPAAGAGRPDRRARPHRGVHPHQARRQEADQAADRRRRAGGRAARQPAQNARDPQPGRVLRRHRARRWSPPTSPPAASTSTTSAWSSTPTRRSSTRPTCTARAAPPAPAPTGTVVTLMTDDQVARRARPDPQGRHHADHDAAATPATRCCASWPRVSAPSPTRSSWPRRCRSARSPVAARAVAVPAPAPTAAVPAAPVVRVAAVAAAVAQAAVARAPAVRPPPVAAASSAPVAPSAPVRRARRRHRLHHRLQLLHLRRRGGVLRRLPRGLGARRPLTAARRTHLPVCDGTTSPPRSAGEATSSFAGGVGGPGRLSAPVDAPPAAGTRCRRTRPSGRSGSRRSPGRSRSPACVRRARPGRSG